MRFIKRIKAQILTCFISLLPIRYLIYLWRGMLTQRVNALESREALRFLLSNVLEHIPKRPAFLQYLLDRTKASRFLIRVPLFERDWRVPLKKEVGVDWRLDTTHETKYTMESFLHELNEAHLKPIHMEVRWGEIWSEVVPDG